VSRSLTSLVLPLPPGFLPQVKSVVLFSCEKFITLDRNRVSIKPLEWKWVVDDNQPDPSPPSHRSSSRPETSSTLCREGQNVQSITSLSSAAASLHLNTKLNPSESHRWTVHFVKSLQILTNKYTYITFT